MKDNENWKNWCQTWALNNMPRRLTRLNCVGHPSLRALCPASEMVHSGGFQSSMVCLWHPVCGTRHPSPSQNSGVWCTSSSAQTQPRSPAGRTERGDGQSPDCWRHEDCSQVESYRRSSGESRDTGCNCDSEQRYLSHSDTLRTPHHQRSTDADLQYSTNKMYKLLTNILYVWIAQIDTYYSKC